MIVQSGGNTIVFGDEPLSPTQFYTGLAISGLTGGTMQGLSAYSQGASFWTGKYPIQTMNVSAISEASNLARRPISVEKSTVPFGNENWPQGTLTEKVLSRGPRIDALPTNSLTSARSVDGISIWPGPPAGAARSDIGAIINGRSYRVHPLERMAPAGLIQQGNQVLSRGVPPSAVENAILHGTKQAGRYLGTIVHQFENVTVVTNESYSIVYTVYKTGH
jgi:hypothetical protein